MKKILWGLFFISFFSSCNEYQKALKSEDVEKKFTIAAKMYDTQKYNKAIRLFEQMVSSYRGKPNAEKMFYMFAQSYYKTKQYYLAGYQFESFVSNYPKSERLEEAAFLGAKSFTMLSPVYSLDQADTNKAVEKLQAFIDMYPDSKYFAEANVLMKKMTEKLEKKAFENAKGYHTISDYKSAIVALDNFIADYPGTSFKENALYYKFDAAYQLGINSVPSKMAERLQVAKIAYNGLMKFNPNTKYKEKANEMLIRIETDLEKLNK